MEEWGIKADIKTKTPGEIKTSQKRPQEHTQHKADLSQI